MTEVTTTVRPRAQYLRQMPTLARQTPEQAPPRLGELARSKDISFVLELKLETPGARYWLCTQGLPEASPGVPKSFVVEYITPEYPRPDGTWELDDAAAYGPQNTPWLQGNDYLNRAFPNDRCVARFQFVLQHDHQRARQGEAPGPR